MAEASSIEWTDATWNIVTGCQVVSPGCTNCYAMKLAGTRLQHHASRAGLTSPSKAGPVWNGQVRFNAGWLTQPLRWKRPRKIFVCAHGDLFADGVDDAWLDQVFAVMALAPQHTFQVLTKRPARMRAYLTADRRPEICAAIDELYPTRTDASRAARDRIARLTAPGIMAPLENVWLGVSAEDQVRADERIPQLLATPAAMRFVSLEPLLGPIDLTRLRPPGSTWQCALEGREHIGPAVVAGGPKLDWVIVGGESGAGARPMHPAWARQIRDACDAAGVPFFFKQWGAWEENTSGHPIGGNPVPGSDNLFEARRFADGLIMNKVGKHAAGRLLDGVEHNWMPGQGLG